MTAFSIAWKKVVWLAAVVLLAGSCEKADPYEEKVLKFLTPKPERQGDEMVLTIGGFEEAQRQVNAETQVVGFGTKVMVTRKVGEVEESVPVFSSPDLGNRTERISFPAALTGPEILDVEIFAARPGVVLSQRSRWPLKSL